MGKKYENECCDCAVPGYPCDGSHKRVLRYRCDRCDKIFSPDDLFDINGEMVCEDCAAEVVSFRDLLEDRYGTVRE